MRSMCAITSRTRLGSEGTVSPLEFSVPGPGLLLLLPLLPVRAELAQAQRRRALQRGELGLDVGAQVLHLQCQEAVGLGLAALGVPSPGRLQGELLGGE